MFSKKFRTKNSELDISRRNLLPSLLEEVVNDSVEAEHDENCDEDVIYRSNVTDFKKLAATRIFCDRYFTV